METQTYSTRIVSKAGGTVNAGDSTVYSADAETAIDNQVDAGDTLNEAIAIDVSTIEAFYIYSDQAVTVTPMEGVSATGDGPFTLLAKKALWWNSDRLEACPFTIDFDSLAIHNAGATVANVKAGFLVHAAS